MKSQHEIAQSLLDEADADGHEFDLTALDILDYMGILGVSFAEGDNASKEYAETLQSRKDQP